MYRPLFTSAQLNYYLDTVWAIAASEYCSQFVIGFTSGQSKKRFSSYKTNGYNHIVTLENNLTRAEAAFLEEKLQYLIKNTDDRRKVYYRKYHIEKRHLPYSPNYGGRGSVPADAREHAVYMAWI
jgi:hypothetical protein